MILSPKTMYLLQHYSMVPESNNISEKKSNSKTIYKSELLDITSCSLSSWSFPLDPSAVSCQPRPHGWLPSSYQTFSAARCSVSKETKKKYIFFFAYRKNLHKPGRLKYRHKEWDSVWKE